MADVTVPDIGDFTDVPVIEILVSEGDEVSAEDPLVTLESDKATMDVPSPGNGTVKSIKVSVGDKVSEGDVILVLDDGDAEGGEEDEEQAGEEPPAEKADDEEGPDGEEPDGEDADGEGDSEDGDEKAEQAPEPTDDSARGEEELRGDQAPGEAARPPADVYAGPGARRRARELGIDLTKVKGSGRKGRITVEDVEAAAKGGGERAGAADAAGFAELGLRPAPWPHADYAKYGEVETVELSRIKKLTGPNLQRNWVVMPHVTHNDEADITELEEFRKKVNVDLKDEGVKMTMVALLIKACVTPLKLYPEFNSSLDESGENLILKRFYNIGFAADTPQGLLVPVVRDADRKGLVEIAAELRELSGKAREGKLSPGEMAGASFTISSLGGIGGTSFTPIVNAPQVAILGATRSAMKPVWDGEQFVPRLMLPLSLSYDHRVIDGAAAARFVVALVEVLEDMKRTLL